MTGGLWLGVYAHVATLLLPVVCCAGVGAVWGVRKLTYPAEFIAMLATVVSTPARTLGPAATFPNTGNLGLPIAQLAFGDTGLAVAVAVAVFAVNSLVQHTLGVWVMSRGGNRSQPQPWPKGVMFACRLAVVLRAADVAAPAPVLESARLVGSLAVPLMLLSLGYALVTVSRAGIRQGAVLGAMRLLIGLLAGALVIHLINLPPLVAGVMTLQFAMPVAAAVQHLRRRGGRRGAGVDGSVRGAVSAAHLAGERKPILIRGWPSPAAPYA